MTGGANLHARERNTKPRPKKRRSATRETQYFLQKNLNGCSAKKALKMIEQLNCKNKKMKMTTMRSRMKKKARSKLLH